jgi:GNAT superfamily N-acetyltransferase
VNLPSAVARVVVRDRTERDVDACVRVLAAVHEQDGYPSRWHPDAAGWLTPPRMVAAWVAETSGTICGHVAVVAGVDDPQLREAMSDSTDLLAVTRLFVDPGSRGMGIGELLLGAATRYATDRRLGLVLDVVDDGRSPAIALYERLGWRLVGHRYAGWVTADGEHPLLRLYALTSQ